MPVKNNFNNVSSPAIPAPRELIAAIDRNRVDTVRDLLKRGADIAEADKAMGTVPGFLHCEGFTILGWAANNGYKEIVELLLKAGAAIDGKDKSGLTPLARAVVNYKPDTVRLLIISGASLEETNDEGRTVAYFAKGYTTMENRIQQAVKDRRRIVRTAEKKAAQKAVASQRALRAAVAAKQDILKADARKFTLKSAP